MNVNPVQIIARKRDGHRLSAKEIVAFMDGYVRGDVADYQMSALAMAIYCRSMDTEETATLTRVMLQSGATLPWPPGSPTRVDKHSTGGVGDKVSLVLAPLLASCGLQVPMISGRGLGTTGGTLDKLESIPGFRTDLSLAELCDTTQRVGCVITGATPELVPADRKLYALRDVTATVGSIPLITASILSKKLAEQLSALVLDVKFGSGTFMKSLAQARGLAQSLVDVGQQMGLPTTALLTDMNQPLGRMVGNAVEVDEAIDSLSGRGPADLMSLVFAHGIELLLMTKTITSEREGRRMLSHHITSGRALDKLREMIIAQGGNPDTPRPVAPTSEVLADRSGYVTEIDAEVLGACVITLGGGRRVMTDSIDHSVGLEAMVKVGDRVETGQPLLRVFAEEPSATTVRSTLGSALRIGDSPPDRCQLVEGRLSGDQPSSGTRAK